MGMKFGKRLKGSNRGYGSASVPLEPGSPFAVVDPNALGDGTAAIECLLLTVSPFVGLVAGEALPYQLGLFRGFHCVTQIKDALINLPLRSDTTTFLFRFYKYDGPFPCIGVAIPPPMSNVFDDVSFQRPGMLRRCSPIVVGNDVKPRVAVKSFDIVNI